MNCDFSFQFFIGHNTAGNQKPQVTGQGIFFPKVLYVLDYDNNSVVSDDDDSDDDDYHLSTDDDESICLLSHKYLR